jgi:EAL domain-containing protein (putative c-di-GMP-specific phosphodiesterase class I)
VQLRPEFIKLDITMTRRIETDAARQLLVEKLQGFAAEVGATLIAEGIETDGQIDKLLSLGVGAGQGFRLGRPGPLPPAGEDGELVWKGRHAFEDRGQSSSVGDAITSAPREA